MVGIKNLRSLDCVLLFELEDVRYLASHRSKVRRALDPSLSMEASVLTKVLTVPSDPWMAIDGFGDPLTNALIFSDF